MENIILQPLTQQLKKHFLKNSRKKKYFKKFVHKVLKKSSRVVLVLEIPAEWLASFFNEVGKADNSANESLIVLE